MITADDPVVQAFARIGWGWGGSWNSLKDYQHFSASNR
nr:M15 family metallopeptidase [Nocardioides alcanivorans]